MSRSSLPYSPYTRLPTEPRSRVGFTHCNSAPFTRSVKSELGVPWKRASWRVSWSEIWDRDWYEAGLFVLAVLLRFGPVSTKAQASHSWQPRTHLTTDRRLACGGHSHQPGSPGLVHSTWPSRRDRTFMKPLNLMSKGPLTSCTKDPD